MIKMHTEKINEVRALYASGFGTRSIGEAYGISPKQIWNIVSGRAWGFVPIANTELPMLNPDAAKRLRLRNPKKLSKAQQQAIDEYRKRLAESIDDVCQREARAIELLIEWTPKRIRAKKKVTTR